MCLLEIICIRTSIVCPSQKKCLKHKLKSYQYQLLVCVCFWQHNYREYVLFTLSGAAYSICFPDPPWICFHLASSRPGLAFSFSCKYFSILQAPLATTLPLQCESCHRQHGNDGCGCLPIKLHSQRQVLSPFSSHLFSRHKITWIGRWNLVSHAKICEDHLEDWSAFIFLLGRRQAS